MRADNESLSDGRLIKKSSTTTTTTTTTDNDDFDATFSGAGAAAVADLPVEVVSGDEAGAADAIDLSSGACENGLNRSPFADGNWNGVRGLLDHDCTCDVDAYGALCSSDRCHG